LCGEEIGQSVESGKWLVANGTRRGRRLIRESMDQFSGGGTVVGTDGGDFGHGDFGREPRECVDNAFGGTLQIQTV
jgi:hypothetical protein